MKTFITFTEPLESALEKHPDHVHAIGMISIEIANMEGSIALLLMPLLDINGHRARIIYFTPKASIARLEIVQNLIDTLPKEHVEARRIIKAILVSARRIFNKRHSFVHNGWGFSDEHNEVVTLPLPAKQRFDSTPVPLRELNEFVKWIRELNTQAWNARSSVENVLHPDTSPQIWIEVGGSLRKSIK